MRRGEKGVGILVDKDLRELVVEVRKVNYRLMSIKLVAGGFTLNMISAYAPQVGLDEEVKRHFWEDLDEVVRGIPPVRSFSYGEISMATLGRRLGATITCMSALVSELETEVELHCWILLRLLIWKSGKGPCADCKVILSENFTTQHRLLVMYLEIMRNRRKRVVFGLTRIKWGALTKDRAHELGDKLMAMGAWKSSRDASGMWIATANCIREAAREILGVSKGLSGGREGDWWWSNEIQGKVEAKKATYLQVLESVDEEEMKTNKEQYKMAKKRTQN
ncbi:uncharacterized protein [Nicotiana sylvestris]|uniref:uncharacterized protein n=1 Tax=Nicotiana sylvestris TaxID=4096 RepID=UPI00388C51CA